MIRWNLQNARNKLSELVRKAAHEGPQIITVHGRDAVVVLSAREFKRIAAPKGSLVEFLRSSPLREVPLDTIRSRDTGRPVRL